MQIFKISGNHLGFTPCRFFFRLYFYTRTTQPTYKAKKLPPGQAKKIYGGKSAKRYAPGQNK